MNPTAAITLYISIFTVIFVIILLFTIFKTNKQIASLFHQLDVLREDLEQIKSANKEVIRTVISPDAVSRVFHQKYTHSKKDNRKVRRRERWYDAEQKIKQGLETTEHVVGLKLLDKLGVVFILAGLVFLVGLGIEYDWINTIGRVFFGIVLSGILLAFGYLFKDKYPRMSSVLFGGGFASLIFTVFAAFYQYELISVGLAYLLVALVVIVAVVVAIITGVNEVAILTFAAGFLAPFTVNLVGKDYWILFSYVILLNIGVIIFDYFRKSLFINIISYSFTFLIYAIWLIKQFLKPHVEIPFTGAIMFLSVFYILIFFIVITNNIRSGTKFLPLEFSMLVTATAMYYTAGYIIIKKVGVDYQGIFTLWIAVVNYAFFLWLYPKKNYDRRILNLFLGLTMMFLALVVPVEFMGKSPTLVWALQAIVLMFVGIKAQLNGMKLGSLELTVLMLGSLAFDLYDQYISTIGELEAVTPLLNRAFLSSMLAVFSLFFNGFLLRYDKTDYFGFKFLKKKIYQTFLFASGLVAFYIAVRLELKYAAIQVYDSDAVVKTYLSLLNYGLLTLLALPALFTRKRVFAYGALLAFVIAFAIYVFDYAYTWADLRNEFLLTPYVGLKEFRLHYFGVLMLLTISVAAVKSIAVLFETPGFWAYVSTFFVSALIVIFVSNEIDNIVVVKQYQPHLLIQALLQKIYRLHYSLVWGVLALSFVLTGILLDSHLWRVSGVILYLLTIVKVIFYDFPKLGNEDLIILFVSLGTVLLAGALLYQWYFKKKTAVSNLVN